MSQVSDAPETREMKRRIEAALLYTAAPRLFELPEEVLAAHKPGFVAMQQS